MGGKFTAPHPPLFSGGLSGIHGIHAHGPHFYACVEEVKMRVRAGRWAGTVMDRDMATAACRCAILGPAHAPSQSTRVLLVSTIRNRRLLIRFELSL